MAKINLKVILFDMDGVVIKQRKVYFSQRYSEEYNKPLEDVLEFFKGEFQDCTLGLLDLRQVLPKYLAKWGWEQSLDEFLDYWFSGERAVNTELVDYIDKLRRLGIKCCIVSNNEKYRAAYLSADVGLGRHFDDMFFSHDLGVKKDDPEFFKKVLKILQIEGSKVYFLGDSDKDLSSAKALKIDGLMYTNTNDFKKKIESLIKKG
jgi:putative hydrolase of the HAD superfamily